MQLVVTVDPACNADMARVAAWVRAVDEQAAEFAKAWAIEYTPVVLHAWDVLVKLRDGAELDAFVADSRMLTIEAEIDTPGALGFHDDVNGVVFARVKYQGEDTSVTLSHEVLEEMGDPACDLYLPLGDGREQAGEACDRVEGDTYAAPNDKSVTLSNYLLLAAFDKGSAGPWDKLKQLTAWDAMTGGGYMIVRDAEGNETQLYASTARGEATAQRKKAVPTSRLARRFAAVRSAA